MPLKSEHLDWSQARPFIQKLDLSHARAGDKENVPGSRRGHVRCDFLPVFKWAGILF